MNAKFLSLNTQDFIRSLFVTILTTALTSVIPILQAGGIPNAAQLKQVAMAGVAAGIAYLVKNLLTNSKNQLLTPEVKPESKQQ